MVLVFCIIRTYMEKEQIGKKVNCLLIFALLCTAAYAVNFMTDEYRVMSVATSIMMTAQNFMLTAMLVYTFEFTRLKNKLSVLLTTGVAFAAVIDSLVFLINTFREVAVQYSMNLVDGIYVFGYEGNTWFTIHTILSMAVCALIIGVFAIKCMRIPTVYWKRYSNMIAGLVFTVFVKYLFIAKTFDLRFDVSILLYALMGLIVYWNTFWYSKKTMLHITHAMIIDHMQIPVLLFDYEDVLADFNQPMSDLFKNLEVDNREQTYNWFKQTYSMPKPQGEEQTFSWKIDAKDYDCRVVQLTDQREKSLGKIIVMQDVTALKKAYYDLEYSITYDALTGLYNKNSFIKKCREYQDQSTWPIAIAVCDINELTFINSIYGRKKGDKILVMLANIMREELEGKAFTARLDDGNIAAVFKRTQEKSAAALFDKISQRFTKECSEGKLCVTMEYGIGMKMDDSSSLIMTERAAIESMHTKKLLKNTSAEGSLIGSLTQTLSETNCETEEHVKRTRILAEEVGRKLNLSDIQRGQLSMLTVFHDIGKIAISGDILTKADELKEDEWEILRTHTEKGYRIAKSARELEPIADSILSHHERWDGTGYPNGLKGADIPYLARILAIIDAYDVMTHYRPYNRTLTANEAIGELEKCAGSQFDPELVKAVIKVLRERKNSYEI